MAKKLVLFGAGKIGRSFIAQLFSQGGYEVVFTDTNSRVIDALNHFEKYSVEIKDNKPDTIEVTRVRGIMADQRQAIVNELADCELMATSVGLGALPHVLPVIAEGVLNRFKLSPDKPLDIIIAENMRDGDIYFRQQLATLLPHDFPADRYIGLIETSIGKMVPIMDEAIAQTDPLLVYAEAYNTLILAKNSFRGTRPQIDGLSYKDNMKAWVDRKLFIHNFGHAAVAYLGHQRNPQWKYVWEPLEDSDFRQLIKETMMQSATALQHLYPHEFSLNQLEEHTDELIARFRNRWLGDTIFRVGCDLARKLSATDRVMAPLNTARQYGLPVDKIEQVLQAGYRFRATDESGRMLDGDREYLKTL